MKKYTYLFKRALAGLIDYSFVYGFFLAFVYAFGSPTNEGGYSVTGFLALVPPVFWFCFIVLIEVFYGATLGNAIVGLQPKSLTNQRGELSFGQSIKRHLLDIFDLSPFGIIGLITILNTEKKQRLGDLWAKTIVVENNRLK
jgi:uncharacterized RDD family membrane protein YckC